MDTSILLARVFGITMIVIYLGVLLNQKIYHRFWQNLQQQPVVLFLTGFIALVAGLLVIQVHNIWIADWKCIITILGWLMILSGALRILFPEIALKMVSKVFGGKNHMWPNILSGLMLIIGIYLTFEGFIQS